MYTVGVGFLYQIQLGCHTANKQVSYHRHSTARKEHITVIIYTYTKQNMSINIYVFVQYYCFFFLDLLEYFID